MDPVTIATAIGALVAAVLGGAKGKDVADQRRAAKIVEPVVDPLATQISDLEQKLRSDHASTAAKLDTVVSDVADIKVDLAIIRTKVEANHEYINRRVDWLENT